MDASKYYPGNCSIRCSLKIIPKILNILRVVPKRLQLFSETCFADWLKLENFRNEPHLVHLILQCQSGSDDSLRNVYFSIRGTELTFGAKEFCLVTGFKFGEVIPNTTNNRFVERVFKDNRDKVKLQELKDVFDNNLPELNDEDVVRVCLLLLVELGFKGTEAKNYLDSELLYLVNDLEAWNDFSWGSYLWDITYGQLKNALSKNHREERLGPSPISYSLKGFIFAFKTWILEIFPAFKSITQKKILIPRAVGWNLTIPITWDNAKDIVQGASSKPVNISPTHLEEKTDWWNCSLCYWNSAKTLERIYFLLEMINTTIIDLIMSELADQQTLEDLQTLLKGSAHIIDLVDKQPVHKKTADEVLTFLERVHTFELLQLLCRCEADRNLPCLDLKSAPLTSYSRHRVPKTSDKVKHVESIKNKVEDMIDKGIEIQLSFHSSECLTKEFWVQLLVIDSDGWFTSDHIRVWNSYMYFSRPRNARWTLMPPDFVHFINKGSEMKHFANGSLAPYPPIADVDIMYIPMNINKNHWILLRVDILKWTITVYDSLRDKTTDPTQDLELMSLATSLSLWLNRYVNWEMTIQTPNKFSYIIPEKLAQQVNGMDCGAWCCIFLERLIKEKEIFIEEDQDPTKTAQEFRERFALLCLEHVDKSKYLEGHVSKATPIGDDYPPTISVVGDNTSSPAQQGTGVSIGSFPNLVALEAAPKKEEMVKLAAQKRKAADQGAPASKHSVKFDFSELQSPTRKKCRLEDSVYGVEQEGVLFQEDLDLFEAEKKKFEEGRLVEAEKLRDAEWQLATLRGQKDEVEKSLARREAEWKTYYTDTNEKMQAAFELEQKLRADMYEVEKEVAKLRKVIESRDVMVTSLRDTLKTKEAELLERDERVVDIEAISRALIVECKSLQEQVVHLTTEVISLKEGGSVYGVEQEGVLFQEDLDLFGAEKKKFEEGRLVEAEWKTYYTDTNEKMQAAFELEQKLRADMYEVEKEVAKLRKVIESRDVMVTSLRDTLKTKEAELLERDERVVDIEAISRALVVECKSLQEQVVHLTTEVISLKEDRT